MFGKHFASMYERSMVGAGAMAFAVMGYVISNTKPDKAMGGIVTLNPTLLSVIFGEPVEAVEKAIQFLCSPDPKSTSKADEGRRLVQISDFDYRVVNHAKYRAIKNEEQRREQNRLAQARHRQKAQGGSGSSPKPEKGLADLEARANGSPF